MFTSGPDGEYFTDAPINTIPTKDTWENLSIKELYIVKTQLETKLFDFANNKVIARQLNISISELSQFISFREHDVF